MKVKIEIPKAAVTQWKRNTALDMAIEALKYSEFPNTSDLVSRKAVREMVSDWAYDMMEQEDLEMALQDVDELPPAQDFHSDFADLRAEQEERNITSPVLHPVKET
jgi:hypothetical protein